MVRITKDVIVSPRAEVGSLICTIEHVSVEVKGICIDDYLAETEFIQIEAPLK